MRTPSSQAAYANFFAMRHPIDPKIDCVFKALLGAEDNRVLLMKLTVIDDLLMVSFKGL